MVVGLDGNARRHGVGIVAAAYSELEAGAVAGLGSEIETHFTTGRTVQCVALAIATAQRDATRCSIDLDCARARGALVDNYTSGETVPLAHEARQRSPR